jgi:hypothetical protein
VKLVFLEMDDHHQGFSHAAPLDQLMFKRGAETAADGRNLHLALLQQDIELRVGYAEVGSHHPQGALEIPCRDLVHDLFRHLQRRFRRLQGNDLVRPGGARRACPGDAQQENGSRLPECLFHTIPSGNQDRCTFGNGKGLFPTLFRTI